MLVVDDEPDVADSFARLLERRYDVRTAYGGEAALSAVDDDVDVVLLDRRMPDLSGDEVLGAIRERDVDCRVVMVTAVTPDAGDLELPADDYLVKPVAGDVVFETIDEQLALADAPPAVAELAAIEAKLDVLEEYATSRSLEADDTYGRLTERAAQLRAEVDGGAAGED